MLLKKTLTPRRWRLIVTVKNLATPHWCKTDVRISSSQTICERISAPSKRSEMVSNKIDECYEAELSSLDALEAFWEEDGVELTSAFESSFFLGVALLGLDLFA